jgi:carbamoyltransferase
MTAILGISAFYHDSAAALVMDGNIVAAAQEERFSRKKHDARFPTAAIAYCLGEARLKADQLDYIVYYEKPLLKFERLLETYLTFAPRGFLSFARAIPQWLKDKLFLRKAIRREVSGSRAPLIFLDHHESHAASAFFPSPFEEAAILTLDGVGEWSTTCFGAGTGNRIRLTHHLSFPHSLGLLYSAFTYYCGFKVNSGEYKLMGLAPYGEPIFKELILTRLVDLKSDGSLRLNMDYFNYCQSFTMTNGLFARLFGGEPRNPESKLTQRHMDLAASIQAVTEEAMLRIAHHVHHETNMKNLVLAGGVTLNCVANGRLLREGPFEKIWIQPASGDAGGALGAALFVFHQLLDNPRIPNPQDSQKGSFLGPKYSSSDIRAFLSRSEVPYRHLPNEAELLDHIAELLEDEKVVGWFHGRMEFGPRALGARSILGDPRSPKMQAMLNQKIKFRESFRPFAPAVLREHAQEWFDVPPGHGSPYMLLVAPVREVKRRDLSPAEKHIMKNDSDLCRRVNVCRSAVPAVTHVDYSARLQTVDDQRHSRFHRLIEAFYARTGCPMVVNTSFNVRGEPIVCTPQEALRCFLATDMDALVLEDFVLLKEDMNSETEEASREEYLAEFQLD